MLRAWRSPAFRPTMDIDILGRTSNDELKVLEQVRNILTMEVAPDGLVFDPTSIYAERITEDADYEGIRLRFNGLLASARITMQVDIGFGDVVYPEPEEIEYPTILNSPVPKLLCYSRESTIAEKFEAMVKLGEINSRIKDFYDIWLLSRKFEFEGEKLANAIRLTFEKRKTKIPDEIIAFSEKFIESRQSQWVAFKKRLEQSHIPAEFAEIVSNIKDFLHPIIMSMNFGSLSLSKWIAPGPWI